MSIVNVDFRDELLLGRVFGPGYTIILAEQPGDTMYKVSFTTSKGPGVVCGDTLEMCMRVHLDALYSAEKENCHAFIDGECDYWYEKERSCRFACDDSRLGYCLLKLFKL